MHSLFECRTWYLTPLLHISSISLTKFSVNSWEMIWTKFSHFWNFYHHTKFHLSPYPVSSCPSSFIIAYVEHYFLVIDVLFLLLYCWYSLRGKICYNSLKSHVLFNVLNMSNYRVKCTYSLLKEDQEKDNSKPLFYFAYINF